MVTAVEAEREAIRARAQALDVAVVGVGMAAAAAHAAIALTRLRADAVVCAGIAGGFTGRAGIGDVVVATRSIAGDLGADSPGGFIAIDDLGFGRGAYETTPPLREALVESLDATRAAGPASRHARTGAVISVNTVTGVADAAARLAARHPDVCAEAMEGYGVACAAVAAGVAFGEVRTISNLVGPRDRGAWRVGEALAALADVGAALAKLGG